MAKEIDTDANGSEGKTITPTTITADGGTLNSKPSNNGRSGSYLREEMQASKNATTSTSNGNSDTSAYWQREKDRQAEQNHLKDNNGILGNPDTSAYWQREKDRQAEQERNRLLGDPDTSAYWQREKDRQAILEREKNKKEENGETPTSVPNSTPGTPGYSPQNNPGQIVPTTSTTRNTLMMNEEEINNLINRIRKVIEELDGYWSYIKNNCMEKVKNSWVANETKTYVDSVLAEDNNVNKIKESLLLLANTYEGVRNNINNTQSENARYIQNNF